MNHTIPSWSTFMTVTLVMNPTFLSFLLSPWYKIFVTPKLLSDLFPIPEEGGNILYPLSTTDYQFCIRQAYRVSFYF